MLLTNLNIKSADEFVETDEGIYSADLRQEMLDNDQLSPEEEAFMRGWDEAE